MQKSALLIISALAAAASVEPVGGALPLTYLPLETGAACLDGSPYGTDH